ncbi:hypothetical protein [uncultured Psychromonas sp.]|uniref:hypothetical protein n=1 Tax=uncultured Psychromonas sp. TaxID=173974 RepID=UPI002613A114|nr:hypothetical protein [uncultured Psychromonas sp.]
MKVIKQIEAISNLPIPDEIQSQLHAHLTLPFNNSGTDAQKFWHEYPIQLVLIEPSDTIDLIHQQNEELHRLIHDAFIAPEYVISIASGGETYLLAMLITSDEGAGFYLLVSTTNDAFPMFQLTNQLD